jgi:hypothetical protein
MKTRQDVEFLKANWKDDPCWDLETTVGFEAYKDELLKYRLSQEEKWWEEYNNRLKEKAEEMGIPGNIKLAAYIEKLEDTIKRLDNTRI